MLSTNQAHIPMGQFIVVDDYQSLQPEKNSVPKEDHTDSPNEMIIILETQSGSKDAVEEVRPDAVRERRMLKPSTLAVFRRVCDREERMLKDALKTDSRMEWEAVLYEEVQIA